MSENTKARFDELTKQIIDLLVAACPLQVKITAEVFNLPRGKVSAATGGFIGGFYTSSPEEEMLDSTLAWLEAEGFIRKGDTEYYIATLLTLKIYNSVPFAVSE